jgi:hypothetical protein
MFGDWSTQPENRSRARASGLSSERGHARDDRAFFVDFTNFIDTIFCLAWLVTITSVTVF